MLSSQGKSELKDPCPICYEEEVSTLAETPCGHIFCEDCINL